MNLYLLLRHSVRGGVALLALAVAGCSTSPLPLQTPMGAVASGDVLQPLVILGVAHRISQSNNQTNGAAASSETITVDVPVGTEVIIPSVQGWTLAYGSATPGDLTNSAWTWRTEDHHLGLEFVDVAVVSVGTPDRARTRQTAQLRIRLLLRDVNGDDPWFAGVNYSLLFLGRR